MTEPAKRSSNISRRRKNARADGSLDYAAKRGELVAIAATLFREQGFEKTSLADVGKRAGLDRATVYYYVGGKDELLHACIEGVLDENLATAERLLVDTTLGPRMKLRNLITTLMRSYDGNYPAMYVYIQEQMHLIAHDPSKWAKDVLKKTRRLDAITRELIDQGVAQGAIRKDVDARIATRALFGMLNWTHRWYHPGGEVSADAVADTFSRIFFEGMEA